MRSIDELLQTIVEAGASDLHIKSGSPPVMRVDGELQSLDDPSCGPEDTKDYAASLMSDKQIRRFSETNEIDFAYSAPNDRPIPGQRVPSARQYLHRPAAGRHPHTRLRRAHAPVDRAEAVFGASGLGAGHRHHRVREDDHPSGDDRPHQHQPAPAHRHQSRIPSRSCTATRTPSSTSARWASIRSPTPPR